MGRQLAPAYRAAHGVGKGIDGEGADHGQVDQVHPLGQLSQQDEVGAEQPNIGQAAHRRQPVVQGRGRRGEEGEQDERDQHANEGEPEHPVQPDEGAGGQRRREAGGKHAHWRPPPAQRGLELVGGDEDHETCGGGIPWPAGPDEHNDDGEADGCARDSLGEHTEGGLMGVTAAGVAIASRLLLQHAAEAPLALAVVE